MDPRTLQAYELAASSYATEWHDQPEPSDLHDVVRAFFCPGPTADIGCGSGRDTAWLTENGFPAIGYDASRGLLVEARARHPEIEFVPAALPELEGIAEERFTNVLCETVIMHLPPELVDASVRRLLAILEPGGTLYLSWRVTTGADRRDEAGRLYAVVDPALVTEALRAATILYEADSESESSGRTIRRVVARRVAAP